MWYFTFRKQIIIRLSILNKCSVTKNHKSTNHSISNRIPMVAKCYNVGKIPQNRHLCRLVSSILLFLYNCNILCKLINHFGRMKSDRRWHIRSDNLEFHNSFRKNVNRLWIYVMPVIFFCLVKSVFYGIWCLSLGWLRLKSYIDRFQTGNVFKMRINFSLCTEKKGIAWQRH